MPDCSPEAVAGTGDGSGDAWERLAAAKAGQVGVVAATG